MDEKTELQNVVVKVPLHDGVSKNEEPRKSWKLPLVCSIWIIASIGNMFLSKNVMGGFKLNMTVLMVQLISISLYTWMFMTLCGVTKNNKNLSWLNCLKLISPVAGSIFVRITIVNDRNWTTPISDPYTAEADACFPFFVLLFSKFMLCNNKIEYWHISLAMLAAWSFINLRNWIFMHNAEWIKEFIIYAILAAFEMTFSKKIIQETGIHPLRLLLALSSLILLVILPKWIWEMCWSVGYTEFVRDISNWESITLILLLGALSSVQAASAFTILSMVPLECYAIGSICNRIIRIFSFPFLTIISNAAYGWRFYDGESEPFV